MIELKNLSKTYLPNKETQVHALKDINLTLGNKGLVFLLGKSGSGKTTLLNMVGGLDKPTQGQIVVDGKELDLQNEKEINAYRNNKIGFIFQSYGLLEDLTVKSNIKTALDLQNSYVNDEQIEDILQAVGLPKESINRKVSHLSGGQKQRVAIARALIKNSHIILADEPTGNLDEKNSREIFELLKRLAKTRLVVVVTHSKKFAEEYAERIITLKDGSIEGDEIKEENDNKKILQDEREINKFPLLTSFRFAFSSIWHVKLRFILTLIFMIVSLTMFGAGISATRYNKYELYETVIKDNNIHSYTLVNSAFIDGKRSALQPQQLDNIQKEDSLVTYFGIDFSIGYTEDYGASKGKRYRVVKLNSEKYFYPDSVAAFDAWKLNAQGVQLIKGQAPKNQDEIVITSYFAEGLLEIEEFRKNYGVETLDDFINKYYKFVSKGNISPLRKEVSLKIVGIADAHMDYDRILSLEESKREQYASDGLNRTIFVSQELLQGQLFNYSETVGELECYQGIYMDINGELILMNLRHIVKEQRLVKQSTYNLNIYNDTIMWIDGHDTVLKEDEIILSTQMFAYVYNEEKNELALTGIQKFDMGIISEKLNEGITCDIKIDGQIKTVKPVGVYMSNYNVILVSDDLELPTKEVEVKSISSTFDKDNIEKNLRTFEQNEVTMTGDLYEALQKASNEITPTAIFGILGFVVFGLFAVMMLTSFMSSMIEDNYKQLGVLRALGASRGNLIGIYLLVAAIFVILCNIIAMPMLPVVKGFMQAKEIAEVVQGYVIFETKWYDYIIMIALSAGITFGASIAHILTKTKATPIEMLKGKT